MVENIVSKVLSSSNYAKNNFEIGDTVSFLDPDGDRITGEIVRIYNTRTLLHVIADGVRYSVDVVGDKVQ